MPRPIPIQVHPYVRMGRPVRTHLRRVTFLNPPASSRWELVHPIQDIETQNIIGEIQFAPTDRDKIVVSDLYIEDREQGKGYGTAVMRELEQTARKHHASEIDLVFPSVQGQRLYSKMGYLIDHNRVMHKRIV